MSPFTDEDLRQMKERIAFAGADTLMAPLVARLEAAEQVCKELRPAPTDHSDYVYGSTRDKLKKWLCACGLIEAAGK